MLTGRYPARRSGNAVRRYPHPGGRAGRHTPTSSPAPRCGGLGRVHKKTPHAATRDAQGRCQTSNLGDATLATGHWDTLGWVDPPLSMLPAPRWTRVRPRVAARSTDTGRVCARSVHTVRRPSMLGSCSRIVRSASFMLPFRRYYPRRDTRHNRHSVLGRLILRRKLERVHIRCLRRHHRRSPGRARKGRR